MLPKRRTSSFYQDHRSEFRCIIQGWTWTRDGPLGTRTRTGPGPGPGRDRDTGRHQEEDKKPGSKLLYDAFNFLFVPPEASMLTRRRRDASAELPVIPRRPAGLRANG